MKIGRQSVRWARDDRGAAIIEFALVAPLLFALVWGIIETGRAFYTINSLASAVRDGARYGATCNLGSYGETPIMNSPCRTGIESIVDVAFQPLGAPLDMPLPLQCCTVVTAAGSYGIKVEVTYNYDPITALPSWDFPITRSAVFRYERVP